MRKGSVRVLSGKVDVTDVVLSQAKVPPTGATLKFLSENMGFTDSKLVEIFGEAPSKPA